MSAFHKCCNGSEVLVAGVVAKGSVEHDLKGNIIRGTLLLEAFCN